MSRKSLLLGIVALGLVLAFGIYFLSHTPPVTVADLQGEWVQDPSYLQNEGGDLDLQKRELEEFENYQFAFRGNHLVGWRSVFDGVPRDSNGWPQGKGVSFESDYSLTKVKGAVLLTFTDHAKASCNARLEWEKDKVFVRMGERWFRLMKGTADQLRMRKLIAAP